MAGVLAQRSREAGHLGAAYFCRHNDSTRNDPRYLLGTIASQLCECNSQYKSTMGGEGGVRKLLGNSNLGVQELFTKLLQEPLGKCSSTLCHKRKLVVVDALDETQYESREDFLDLIMNRFPLLPNWVVFFITSRPENTLQLSLKKYNPCVRICVGNVEHDNFYQQHQQDIKLFLRNHVDFSRLRFSVDDLAKKCNGSFLYAFYIVKDLHAAMQSGKSFQLVDLFPGDFDNFLQKNFKRFFGKVRSSLFKNLFGCAIVAPSPLPVSFISFILQRENPDLDEREVSDAVSQFVASRTSDQTLTFLHNLIPTWLTDKKKASLKFFVDRINAGEYFRDIIVEFLSAVIVNRRWDEPTSIEADLIDYFLRVGVRFLCKYREMKAEKTVFSCLTSYQFIWKRIQNNGIEIYSLVADLKLSASCQGLSEAQREILQKLCLAIESNVYILQECPHLLHSCLRNSPKAVQENVVIPSDGVSATWMKWEDFPYPACEIPRDMSCFALSPDKKTLAGGKGKFICCFDACSLEKKFGPIKVIEAGDDISHLEFSPDGKFVFFGRLDKWFSVEKRCVGEFLPQFLKNCRSYKWGFFTSDGRYILVQGKHPIEQNHGLSCLVNIFCKWATQELDGMRSSEVTFPCDPGQARRLAVFNGVELTLSASRGLRVDHRRTLRQLRHSTGYASPVSYDRCDITPPCDPGQASLGSVTVVRSRLPKHSEYAIKSLRGLLRVLNEKRKVEWFSVLERRLCALKECFNEFGGDALCPECDKFNEDHPETTLADVHQHVIDLYPEIFEYQVWDLQTGRPVLEKAFSGAVLSPFFYLCHMMTDMEASGQKLFAHISEALFLHNLAFMNVIYFLKMDFLRWFPLPFCDSSLSTSFFIANVPTEFYNRPTQKVTRLSPDRNWIAVRKDGFREEVKLLEKGSRENFRDIEPVHIIKDVRHFAFTDDSTLFLYVTGDNSLHALPLQTDATPLSMSGLRPLFYVPMKQLGYIFYVKDEERIRFEENLSSCLPGVVLFKPRESSRASAFVPASTIISLFTDAVLTCLKATDDDAPSTQVFGVRRCVFSQDGNLIATHQGTKILLLDLSNFVCSLCDDRYDENDVSCLTFSPDSALFLYFIQKRRGARTDGSDFYVWDVQNRHICALFDSPSELLSIDCCCFSSDNSKLIICGEFSFEVWKYALGPCSLLRKVETNVQSLYTGIDKFTHCTVSSDCDLLACCIGDRILLYPLKASTDPSILHLPRAHLGKIEFCLFLNGNHYLISYGVDGTVFLWDLRKRKAVAYARVAQGSESILGMVFLPEEDEVICLISSGRQSVIKLHGLVHEVSAEFPTSERLDIMANQQQVGKQRSLTFESAALPADDDKSVDWTKLVEDYNMMAKENPESDVDSYESESDVE